MRGPNLHARRPVRLPAIGAVATFAVLGLVGCQASKADVAVTDAAVPVPASEDTAAVYLTITNSGGTDDVLLSVSTPSAALTHLHKSSVDAEGRATMEAIGTLKIPADTTVKLSPGGLHLMMSKPRPLATGDTVELTLTFKESGTKRVAAKVIDDISEVMGS